MSCFSDLMYDPDSSKKLRYIDFCTRQNNFFASNMRFNC
jgi:hypothetical protein